MFLSSKRRLQIIQTRSDRFSDLFSRFPNRFSFECKGFSRQFVLQMRRLNNSAITIARFRPSKVRGTALKVAPWGQTWEKVSQEVFKLRVSHFFFGKGPDWVTDPFGTVPCRCFNRPRRGKGQIRKTPDKTWENPEKTRESPKKDKQSWRQESYHKETAWQRFFRTFRWTFWCDLPRNPCFDG